jgi:hypothetical protein
MKIHRMGAEFYADRQAGRQAGGRAGRRAGRRTNMRKLIVPSRNFANAPKNFRFRVCVLSRILYDFIYSSVPVIFLCSTKFGAPWVGLTAWSPSQDHGPWSFITALKETWLLCWSKLIQYIPLKRSLLLWGITQRRVVILYRRFGTTYRSHIQGWRSPRRKNISFRSILTL